MIYGGYYQGMPNNMMQYNFGYQDIPNNNIIGNNSIPNMMMNSYQTPNIVDLNGNSSNQLIDLINRISSLENRVKLLEQRISNTNSYQEDNNSMYMI